MRAPRRHAQHWPFPQLHMAQSGALLALFAVLAASSLLLWAPARAGDAAADQAFARCAAHPMCRELYRYSESMTMEQFARQARPHLSGATTLLEARPPALLSAAATNAAELDALRSSLADALLDLTVARLIIGKLALEPQRCPPNMYWFWGGNASEPGRCACFFDRNCAEAATELCQDDIHGVLLVAIIAVIVLVVVTIVVRIYYDPDLYKEKPA